MLDYTWPCTALAVAFATGAIYVEHRRGRVNGEWLLSSSPRTKAAGQGVAVLLTLLLAAGAFSYNAWEFRSLIAGQSGYSWEVEACQAAERASAHVCRQKLASERARFDVLGFSFGLGTAAALLSAVFSATVAAMVIEWRPGKGGEGLVDELLDRRLVRLPLLAALGWLFSYLVGHAWLGATNSADEATHMSTRVMLAILFLASAVSLVARRRDLLAISFAIIGVVGTFLLCIPGPKGFPTFN